MELREKVAMQVLRCTVHKGDEWETADRILAIPEIADALLNRARYNFLDAMGETVDLSHLDKPQAVRNDGDETF